ncbi:MAG TPA: hypothetical protein ENJ42_08485 [Hellea balneolensis]|uniref:Uncharacterized protein n=1 Tax=Hellea balneolensis TaxID=287478 RepID=A0A7C5R178_9PROT|nr:hypothetical protein [Hellea balneolensis]
MRYDRVTGVLFLLALSILASAKPADRYHFQPDKTIPPPSIVHKPAPPMPVLQTQNGYQTRIIARNLGRVVALAISETDLFVLDQERARVIKLRDRDKDGRYEARADYLIGFDHPKDILSGDGLVFISDMSGVWQIETGRGLVAKRRPDLILPVRKVSGDTAPRPIAYDMKAKILYLAVTPDDGPARIFAHDLKNRTTHMITRVNGSITALTTSPAGRLWIAVSNEGMSYIAIVGDNGVVSTKTRLPLLPQNEVLDMAFPKKTPKSDLYPQSWAGGLLITLSGANPMLAYAPFSFGEISQSYISIVEGFATPSSQIGKMDVWGTPTALIINSRGKYIFSESATGTVWQIDKRLLIKSPTAKPTSSPEDTPPKPARPNPFANSRKDKLLHSHFDKDETPDGNKAQPDKDLKNKPEKRMPRPLPERGTSDN